MFAALGLRKVSWFFPFGFIFIFLPLWPFYITLGGFRFEHFGTFLSERFFKSVVRKVQKKLYFSSYLLSSFFLYLLFQNAWNLVPFTISISSNIVFTLLMAFSYWILFKSSRILKNIYSYLAHYTTPSSPLVLVPFIKIVEVVRNIIRPITLGVRLAVKLLTGHLLLRLLRGVVMGKVLYVDSFIILSGMLMVFIFFYETCVLVIQAFVYNLMLRQYLDEHSF